MRRRPGSTRTFVVSTLIALAPSGCFATKGWMRDAERAREPIPLVGATATAREEGRIIHLRLEDEAGQVRWYRGYADQTPALISEEQVLAGAPVPVVPFSLAASPGPSVRLDLPNLPTTYASHVVLLQFADGRSTTLEVPARRSAALSTFMYALTPFVALFEAVLYPVLGPAYLVVALFAQQTG